MTISMGLNKKIKTRNKKRLKSYIPSVTNSVAPIELFEDQKKAKDWILNWFYTTKEISTVLKGYAGTGKTTMMGSVLRDIKSSKLFTAPTHKAAAVLSSKIGEPVITLHRLLGLGPGINLESFDPNSPEFVPIKESIIDNNDLIIVDECSMINKNLKAYLESECKAQRARIIYIGDPAQIPPINEDISETFSIKGVELTKVRRTEVSSILECSSYIRDNILENEINIEKFYDDSFYEDCMGPHIADLFKVPGESKYIAWTNARVNGANSSIRRKLLGENAYRYTEGDVIIPYTSGGEKSYGTGYRGTYMNSEEFIVNKVYNFSYDIRDHIGAPHTNLFKQIFECDLIVAHSIYYPKKDSTIMLVLKPESYEDFVRYVNYRINKAYEMPMYFRSTIWSEILELKSTLLLPIPLNYHKAKMYTTIGYGYAITAHKSQGSTYKQVVLDSTDIMKNQKIWDRNRILYVAISRASDKILNIT